MDSTVTACVVALYPSPGGATESELHFESWQRMRELNPVLARSRARHRGPGRQPPGRPAGVRDRADRPVLRADGHDQGALGGDLGRPRRRGGGRAVLRRLCAPRRRAGVSVHVARTRAGARRPPPPDPEFAVARRAHGALRRRTDARARSAGQRAQRPSGLHDRADDPADDRAGPPRLRRRHARAPGRAVRRAGALGRDDAQPRLVPARRARARVHRLDAPSPCRSPATTTSSSRPPSTCTRCPTAKRRWRCTSTA